ncbi:MAG: hypothetical protein ACTHKM_09555, partial [Tsuneonella sp.]
RAGNLYVGFPDREGVRGLAEFLIADAMHVAEHFDEKRKTVVVSGGANIVIFWRIKNRHPSEASPMARVRHRRLG